MQQLAVILTFVSTKDTRSAEQIDVKLNGDGLSLMNVLQILKEYTIVLANNLRDLQALYQDHAKNSAGGDLREGNGQDDDNISDKVAFIALDESNLRSMIILTSALENYLQVEVDDNLPSDGITSE